MRKRHKMSFSPIPIILGAIVALGYLAAMVLVALYGRVDTIPANTTPYCTVICNGTPSGLVECKPDNVPAGCEFKRDDLGGLDVIYYANRAP